MAQRASRNDAMRSTGWCGLLGGASGRRSGNGYAARRAKADARQAAMDAVLDRYVPRGSDGMA